VAPGRSGQGLDCCSPSRLSPPPHTVDRRWPAVARGAD
jgi:hypothetical protein